MIERAKTTVLAVLVLGKMVTVPDSAHAFFCRYPRTHLSGVADVGGSKFVRLDIDLRFNGAECEVEIAGRGRCRPVAHRRAHWSGRRGLRSQRTTGGPVR